MTAGSRVSFHTDRDGWKDEKFKYSFRINMDTEVNETMYCLTYQKFWQQMAKMSRFLNGSLVLGTLYPPLSCEV